MILEEDIEQYGIDHPDATCQCILVVKDRRIQNLFAPHSGGLEEATKFLESIDSPIDDLVEHSPEILYSAKRDVFVLLAGF